MAAGTFVIVSTMSEPIPSAPETLGNTAMSISCIAQDELSNSTSVTDKNQNNLNKRFIDSTKSSDSNLSSSPSKDEQFSTKSRRGDPRMHRAVAIRLANPKMPLLDALRAGGFEFPDLDKDGVSSFNIEDTDNVNLGQRKNQLSRRLRLVRESQRKKGSFGSLSELDENKTRERDAEKVKNKRGNEDNPDTSSQKEKKLISKSPRSNQETREKIQAAAAAISASTPPSSSYSSSLLQEVEGNTRNYASLSGLSVPSSAFQQYPLFAHLNNLSKSTQQDSLVMKIAAVRQQQAAATSILNSPTSLSSGIRGYDPLSSVYNTAARVDWKKKKHIHKDSSYTPLEETLLRHSTKIPSSRFTASIGMPPLSKIMRNSSMESKRSINSDRSVASASESRDKPQVNISRKKKKNGLDATNISYSSYNKSKDDSKAKIALNFYRAESASILKRCMLMAGYEPQETEECDESYLNFVTEALEAENQRLLRLHTFFLEKRNNINKP